MFVLPGEDEHHKRDDEVRGDDVEPDLRSEGVEEREETGRLAPRSLEEDADAEVHERFRKVDYLFAEVVDCQRGDGEVGFLYMRVRGNELFLASSEMGRQLNVLFFGRQVDWSSKAIPPPFNLSVLSQVSQTHR